MISRRYIVSVRREHIATILSSLFEVRSETNSRVVYTVPLNVIVPFFIKWHFLVFLDITVIQKKKIKRERIFLSDVS